MANMFVPSAFDTMVKEQAGHLRRQTDAEYVPEWEALVYMLADEHQKAFRDLHGEPLSAIQLIAEEADLERPDAETEPVEDPQPPQAPGGEGA